MPTMSSLYPSFSTACMARRVPASVPRRARGMPSRYNSPPVWHTGWHRSPLSLIGLCFRCFCCHHRAIATLYADSRSAAADILLSRRDMRKVLHRYLRRDSFSFRTGHRWAATDRCSMRPSCVQAMDVATLCGLAVYGCRNTCNTGGV